MATELKDCSSIEEAMARPPKRRDDIKDLSTYRSSNGKTRNGDGDGPNSDGGHTDEMVGPDGYLIVALRYPAFTVIGYPVDDEEAAWSVDHLSRFHGWTSDDIERFQGGGKDCLYEDRHLDEHIIREEVGELRDRVAVELEQLLGRELGPEDREPLPIPHVHDRAIEHCIRATVPDADVADALCLVVVPVLDDIEQR